MRVAIHQPNYAPWCGYFAKMRHCDLFVFLDDVQMPGGQSNVYRTRIREREGTQWLSVEKHYQFGQCIHDVRLSKTKWPRRHTGTLRAVYGRCACFNEVLSFLEPIYSDPGDRLSDFNMRLIEAIAAYLELPCRFERSSRLNSQGQSDDRLISLAILTGADTYVSGRGGQKYQDPSKFAHNGINLEVREYQPIPYAQIHGDFVPGLSVLDAVFHLGRDAVRLLDYRRPD